MTEQTIVATQEPHTGSGVVKLPEGWRPAVWAIGAGIAVLGGLGFVNSFARVQVAAMPAFGWFAWTLPVGVDLGIAVFSALELVLAKAGMPTWWVRLIAPVLTAATVYLNVAGEPTVFGKVAHAVLPGLWVAAVAVAALVVRRRAKLERRAATRMDRIRLSRWLLAPWPTIRLYRRMVLWETRSYSEALRREHDRVLALTDLKDAYGSIAWRWKAPRRSRALYRLGELTLSARIGQLEAGRTQDTPAQIPPVDVPAVSKPARPRSAQVKKKPVKSAAAGAKPVDVEPLVPLALQVAGEFEKSEPGRRLTRDELVARMRKAGASLTNEKGSALITRLRDGDGAVPELAHANGRSHGQDETDRTEA